MSAYYNEIDPKAAAWLRELIRRNLIAPGEVDERSIIDVRADDLKGFDQCHFFAGIGVWSYALRSAGWADDRPVWTGSCPCQGHSSAARSRHVERDWWPEWRRLITAGAPRAIFGEQVAAAWDWFDGVRDDLESIGYEVGSAEIPACSIGQDHARPRIYFVGNADSDGKPSMSIDAKAPRLPEYRSDAGSVVQEDEPTTRVALMRAFGNAINAEQARNFIEAYQEVRAE